MLLLIVRVIARKLPCFFVDSAFFVAKRGLLACSRRSLGREMGKVGERHELLCERLGQARGLYNLVYGTSDVTY